MTNRAIVLERIALHPGSERSIAAATGLTVAQVSEALRDAGVARFSGGQWHATADGRKRVRLARALAEIRADTATRTRVQSLIARVYRGDEAAMSVAALLTGVTP